MKDNTSMSKIIKIYGERNTNTNYFEKILTLNLVAEQLPGKAPRRIRSIQKLLLGKEWLRDWYFKNSYADNLGWKHMQVLAADELEEYAVLRRKVIFITITKNPYSWLLSLHRRPYIQQYKSRKKKLAFEEFINTPWQTTARENTDPVIINPVTLWNIKNSSYLPLQKYNGLNLTTEGILKDPEAVINRISNKFGIDKKSQKFINYDKSTKDETKNFLYYQNYYLEEKWREDISSEAISIINKYLDRDLMDHFGYELLTD
ncbi:MAG: hypothetical protein IMF09_07175 [Proteobacteria bacterium]|nr:hypothetical protein [Pseudomonadota bacterium]